MFSVGLAYVYGYDGGLRKRTGLLRQQEKKQREEWEDTRFLIV